MPSEAKKQLVQGLIRKIGEYPLIGLVNMENLPAPQLQKMRAMLKSKGIEIVMTRKTLLGLVLNNSNQENILRLQEKIRGMPALILSRGNPFALYSLIQQNKSEASAKAGQTAPRDIIVRAGSTNFAPGPIISELAAVGIKTKVEGGKLTIITDTLIAKEGEVISQKVAETLKRLDIKPMEIGLNIVAVWENGIVFSSKQLHIDEVEYTNNFVLAARLAMNLALETAYPVTETIELLLQKAAREAKAVAIGQNIINEETMGEILAKAQAQALSIKEEGNIEVEIEPKLKEENSSPVLAEDHNDNHQDGDDSRDDISNKHQDADKEIGHKEKFEKVELDQPVVKEKERFTDTKKVQPDIQFKCEPQLGESPHPKQGNVSLDEAEELFKRLQKKGTLR